MGVSPLGCAVRPLSCYDLPGGVMIMMDVLDLGLGLVVDFPADEVGVVGLGVVEVDLVSLAVDLQVKGLGVNRGNGVRLGHVDGMDVFLMMMMLQRERNDFWL